MVPRFTVLLPTHNRAEVVGFAIESVLAQTNPDFELFIVGDGCTDNTADVVTSFDDVRIRWFDLPKGPAFGYANRNVALREATGELMAFMAHDDLLLPDHLELMAAPFADARVEWAYSRPLWVADDGTIVPFAVDLKMPDQLETFLNDHNSIPASCVVYRRSVQERVGMWPVEVERSADWEMWKRILGSADANSAYVREPTTLHFRADWRTSGAWGPPPLPAWLELAKGSWWPSTLSVTVGAASPQATFAGILSERGLAWVTDLRGGVRSAIDAIAGHEATHIAELVTEIKALNSGVAQSQLKLEQARDEAAKAHAGAKTARDEAAQAHAGAEAARDEVQRALMAVAAAEESTALARLQAEAADGRAEAADQRAQIAQRERVALEAQAVTTNRLLATGPLGFAARVQRKATLRFGRNPLFDETWYRERYPEVTTRDVYEHWRSQGWRENRDPNAWFSTRGYLGANPDVARSGINPLDHYYVRGIAELRRPRARATNRPPSSDGDGVSDW